MIDPKQLDDLAQHLAGSLPSGFQLLQDDLKRNLMASLEAGLAKLDLVTREEFDVQQAVLLRTREKLERLEREVARLEAAQKAPSEKTVRKVKPAPRGEKKKDA
ncbi:MAG TPA: accessory factor UbiK family protein [Chromatiales bacterium]|nr:accessory factor UbiK family protein [Chromatiales bacterium]